MVFRLVFPVVFRFRILVPERGHEIIGHRVGGVAVENGES